MVFEFETTKEMGDYETQQRKQTAADVLYHYSRFSMICIGAGIRPTDLRLRLMKEISGMPTLKKESSPGETFPDFASELSSRSIKGEKSQSC